MLHPQEHFRLMIFDLVILKAINIRRKSHNLDQLPEKSKVEKFNFQQKIFSGGML